MVQVTITILGNVCLCVCVLQVDQVEERLMKALRQLLGKVEVNGAILFERLLAGNQLWLPRDLQGDKKLYATQSL